MQCYTQDRAISAAKSARRARTHLKLAEIKKRPLLDEIVSLVFADAKDCLHISKQSLEEADIPPDQRQATDIRVATRDLGCSYTTQRS